jgi:hypothetical protein
MEQRHMQMIALAGTLGTGLFLGSGKAIAHGGPAGALIAYAHVGTIVYCMCEWCTVLNQTAMCHMPRTERGAAEDFVSSNAMLILAVMGLGEMAVYAPISGGYIHFVCPLHVPHEWNAPADSALSRLNVGSTHASASLSVGNRFSAVSCERIYSSISVRVAPAPLIKHSSLPTEIISASILISFWDTSWLFHPHPHSGEPR